MKRILSDMDLSLLNQFKFQKLVYLYYIFFNIKYLYLQIFIHIYPSNLNLGYSHLIFYSLFDPDSNSMSLFTFFNLSFNFFRYFLLSFFNLQTFYHFLNYYFLKKVHANQNFQMRDFVEFN